MDTSAGSRAREARAPSFREDFSSFWKRLLFTYSVWSGRMFFVLALRCLDDRAQVSHMR
mgnify:CR=1 FL=1